MIQLKSEIIYGRKLLLPGMLGPAKALGSKALLVGASLFQSTVSEWGIGVPLDVSCVSIASAKQIKRDI